MCRNYKDLIGPIKIYLYKNIAFRSILIKVKKQSLVDVKINESIRQHPELQEDK